MRRVDDSRGQGEAMAADEGVLVLNRGQCLTALLQEFLGLERLWCGRSNDDLLVRSCIL